MRLSKAYWQTIKEVPADAEVVSHQLLIRAGFISKTAAGIYSYLPMAVRVLQKIKTIIREELEAIDAQEVSMGFVTPGSLWKKSGRWETMGPQMLKCKDRKDNDYCLSATNEETITDIIDKTITSYKQLPINLFQVNTKFRDEIRPRFGIMRGREFLMKDGYTFHVDKECMSKSYSDYYKAYENIFTRMGLEFIAVEADGGAIADAGAQTHEFQVVADNGEDIIVEVSAENLAMNIEKAQTKRLDLKFSYDDKIEDVLTENLPTCEEVAKFLTIGVHQTLKSIVINSDNNFYMVMLLGDDSLNEVKLSNHLKQEWRFASDTELLSLGLVKGYMGPQNVDFQVLFDSAIDMKASYIVGANKENYHQKGFVPSIIKNSKTVDLRLAKEEDISVNGNPIKFRKGIEVGHIFELGDKYTKSMNVTVLDNNGKKVNPLMGCYGIGVSRLVAAAIEQSHDENGIIWPKTIAPYDVYFATIAKSDETKKVCDDIYKSLQKAGLDVVYDDRGMGFGAMLKDADLLGLPVRVLLGERDFNKTGEVEIKVRKTGETIAATPENLCVKLKEILEKL